MLRVVYVAGWLRSGSTLLCQSLGSAPDTVSLGEVSGVWRAAALNHPCSCGEAITSCSIWGPALDHVRETTGISMRDLDTVAALATKVLRTRDSARLRRLSAGRPDAIPEGVRRYVTLTGALLNGAARAAGVSTVVDSSKLPPGFLTLRLRPDIEVDVVHLVRDPRAVVNSERKRWPQPAVAAALLPPIRSTTRSALYWSAANLAVQHYATAASSYRVLRYEDFTASPDACLSRLCSDLRLPEPLQSVERGTRSAGHLAVGNPSRFRAASDRISMDQRWEAELPWTDRVVVAAVSLPVHSWLTSRGRRRGGQVVRA